MYIYIYIYIYIYVCIIYVYVKAMCPPGYHHHGFVATHTLGHSMYGSSCAKVPVLLQSHCGD